MAFRLNRLNDYFFKWLFGKEERKDILISFLNAVLSLDEQAELVDITVGNDQRLGLSISSPERSVSYHVFAV